jgi:RluA family pseudouridine synthase
MVLPPIIYEDDALVAFDKPAGVTVTPNRGEKTRVDLMALVHARLGHHVANVHRLDADTSGVLLCAKTKAALDFLSGQFQSKTVARIYHALVVALPPERAMPAIAPARTADGLVPDAFTIDLAIGEDERQPGRMRICKKRDGKPGVTECRTLERFRGFAWVECRPQTGRTHQIRVHLAAAGMPILGDTLYGDPTIELRLSAFKRGYKGFADEKPLLRRLALHASELTFIHPVIRTPFTLQAPLPHEFEVALKYLRKFAVA